MEEGGPGGVSKAGRGRWEGCEGTEDARAVQREYKSIFHSFGMCGCCTSIIAYSHLHTSPLLVRMQ